MLLSSLVLSVSGDRRLLDTLSIPKATDRVTCKSKNVLYDSERLTIIILSLSYYRVALIFGVVTCLAGFLGVLIGSESARRLRVRFKSADPVVCAVGQLIAAVCLFAAMISSHYHTSITWVRCFYCALFIKLGCYEFRFTSVWCYITEHTKLLQ